MTDTTPPRSDDTSTSAATPPRSDDTSTSAATPPRSDDTSTSAATPAGDLASSEAPTTRVGRWMARPFVRALVFLLAGAALHLGGFLFAEPAPGPVIRVTTADVERLELEFSKQTGRRPGADTRARLVEREIDDMLLVEDARARGWHRSDPVVQRRLIQNQRFLEADDQASDAEVLERAYAQGMDVTDVVVKRRLIERMRLAIAEASRRTPPAPGDLEAYRLAHLDLFRRPARVDLVQVFVSRDRHGDDIGAAAATLGEQLTAETIDDDELMQLGDPSLLPMRVRGTSREELARRFGHDFAASVFALQSDGFSGPIASSFGLHFVRIDERVEARDPELEEVETAVRSRVERQREEEALLRVVRALREHARIERVGTEAIGTPAPGTTPSP